MAASRVFNLRIAFIARRRFLAPDKVRFQSTAGASALTATSTSIPSSLRPPVRSITIAEAIAHDHQKLQEFYKEVLNNPHDLDRQQRYGNEFIWELARHAVGEELVVYPAFEEYLGAKGRRMAEHDRQDHHETKQLLKEFQSMKSTDANYIPQLEEIWIPFLEHLKLEDSHDMPTLEDELKRIPGASQELARSFTRTKMFVPSRSHPFTGEHPPYETVLGFLAMPIDRLGDMFRRFPD